MMSINLPLNEFMDFHFRVRVYLVYKLGYNMHEADKIFYNMWNVLYNMEHFEVRS